MEREHTYSLLLLAGGKNTRMKRNKAELLYQGKSFAELMISKAKSLGISQIFLSGFELRYEEENINTVWDVYPDRGPLGGIHACMQKMRTPFCLVLPIDAPKLPTEVLEALLDYHGKSRRGRFGEKEIPLIWEHGDRKEPLIAVYPTVMADAVGGWLEEHAIPVFRALDRWGYECFRKEISEQTVINVNTPELYKSLLDGKKIETKKDMEKEFISIYKIQDGIRYEKKDAVALEEHVTFSLKDGSKICAACTPTYVEELILGRRFLMHDLTDEEMMTDGTEKSLKKMDSKEIFRIEREMFEKPGALFCDTGCAHSCVLVRDGNVLVSIEDIGRHNALDKVIGYAVKNRIFIPGCAAFCSGRVSEDYLQKAIDAGFRMVVSRAAVTEAAAALAKKANITLMGFVRKGSGNIYHEGAVLIENEKGNEDSYNFKEENHDKTEN